MTVSEMKLYSLNDVAKRNGQNGAEVWVIIKDIVYNVTPYLDDHPGGGELITEWAGKDATKGYYDFGHSGDADSHLKQYKIGELIEEHRKSKKKTKSQKSKDEQTNNINSTAAKAKAVEASTDIQKDRGFVYYVTCGCLSS